MIEKDILDLRLAAITSAQERSRTAFLSATVASLVVLIVFFNLMFSQVGTPQDQPDRKGLVYEELKKQQVKHFYDRFYYSLPVVGVQVSTDDFSFFAPLGLLIFALYYLSCARSALNQLEGLRKSVEYVSDESQLETVAIVLNSQLVFNSPTSELPFETPIWQPVNRALRTLNVYRLLIYLPALASAAAMYGDIFGTYFSGGALDPPGATFFLGLSRNDQVKVVASELVGLGFTIVVTLYCSAASIYSSRAREVIASLTTGRSSKAD